MEANFLSNQNPTLQLPLTSLRVAEGALGSQLLPASGVGLTVALLPVALSPWDTLSKHVWGPELL